MQAIPALCVSYAEAGEGSGDYAGGVAELLAACDGGWDLWGVEWEGGAMKTDGYKFGSKNGWRRWTWNRIVERLDVPVSKAVGLYLPAEEDLDRDVAKGKGFRDQNLIAVDVDERAVKNVRSKKCPAVLGDIGAVVRAWNEPKLDFVSGDMCCGITDNTARLTKGIGDSTGIKEGTVIALNLLRGRDGGAYIDNHPGFNEVKDEISMLLPHPLGDTSKHRGMMVIGTVLSYMNEISKLFGTELSFRMAQEIWKYMSPVFNNYRCENGHGIMDAVVFKWPVERAEHFNSKYNKSVRNEISAVKAVRTMRLAHG